MKPSNLVPHKSKARHSEHLNTASDFLDFKTDLGVDLSPQVGKTPKDSTWREQEMSAGLQRLDIKRKTFSLFRHVSLL